jgi:tRNA threonylcarbamoyl adenosine modification protein YeaZ
MDGSPLILSIDTATLGGSVCLMQGERMLASVPGDATVSHSSTLLRDVDHVLKTSGKTMRDIELFAVAAGPGSFTGLRIGLATVKALSATLDRPCVGVPTLHAVALAAGPSKATVALLPAGRGELFTQLLSVSFDGVVTEHDVAAHLPPAAVIQRYQSLTDIKWAGAGAHAQQDFLREQAQRAGFKFESETAASKGWTQADREENLAKEIAVLARQRWPSAVENSAESLRADYVRPSDPELKECR